jgi:hypothetical protein
MRVRHRCSYQLELLRVAYPLSGFMTFKFHVLRGHNRLPIMSCWKTLRALDQIQGYVKGWRLTDTRQAVCDVQVGKAVDNHR